MKRLIPYITFAFLTSFTVATSSPILAGGCNRQMNNIDKIKCSENNTKCQTEKAEKSISKETVES